MVHENCDCTKYAPDFKETGIRYTGNVYRCKGCQAWVDGNKWKGGIKHFGNRTRLLRHNDCPCCGSPMSNHRRAKYRLVTSIEKQITNPELQPHIEKQLPKKIKILTKIHTHTLH